ncbi:MAG: hypothetical protein AAGI25_10260, partial [Bacteroidota bacterium]
FWKNPYEDILRQQAFSQSENATRKNSMIFFAGNQQQCSFNLKIQTHKIGNLKNTTHRVEIF